MFVTELKIVHRSSRVSSVAFELRTLVESKDVVFANGIEDLYCHFVNWFLDVDGWVNDNYDLMFLYNGSYYEYLVDLMEDMLCILEYLFRKPLSDEERQYLIKRRHSEFGLNWNREWQFRQNNKKYFFK